MSIEHFTYLGEAAVRARNVYLSLTVVPAFGGKMVSLVDERTGLEMLRQAPDSDALNRNPVLYGDPVLFPPNRIEDGAFTFRGRSYQFDINWVEEHNHNHGFVFARPWTLKEATESNDQPCIVVEFASVDHPDVLRQFPHDFVLQIQYTLQEATLTKRAILKNRSQDALPVGFGYHTTFRFPLGDGSDLASCRLRVPSKEQWVLNERNLPTGMRQPVDQTLHTGGWSLESKPLDHPFRVDPSLENVLHLDDPQAGIHIGYRCDHNFTQWVIYNADAKQGFVCPEPYTWVTNAPNLHLSWDQTGMQALEPGETHVMTSEITVSHDGNS